MKFYKKYNWQNTASRNTSWVRFGKNCGWLRTASVDVMVADHAYGEENNSLLDLSIRITEKIQTMMSRHRFINWINKRGFYETISPDGPNAFDRKGIMNVYLAGLPPHLIDNVLLGVVYFAKKFGTEAEVASIDTWAQAPDYLNKPDEVTDDTPRVARVRIDMGEPVENVEDPPRLNLSNQSARQIFIDILGYPDDVLKEFDPISVPDLINRIKMKMGESLEEYTTNTVEEDPLGNKATIINMGRDETFFKDRLQKILKIAEWAFERGYDTIAIA